MNNREAFEEWFSSEMPMESLITNQDNDYKYQPAIASWESWQAALASQQQDHIGDSTEVVCSKMEITSQVQEPYAYDVPTKSGTKLAYAIYYTKYNNPLPEGAIPLYV